MLKNIIVCLLIMFIYELFNKDIYKYINEKFPNLNFETVTIRVIFGIIISLIFTYLWKRIKVPSINYIFNGLLILIIYLLYRQNVISHENWHFSEFYSNVYFLDIILVSYIILCLKVVVICYRNRNSEPKSKQNYIPERPIINKGEDKLNYYIDAEKLLDRIIDNKFQVASNAMVIALEGKWGQGKTSYMNMFKDAVINSKHKNNVIVIRFNTWLSHDYNQLVQNFLRTIANGINDISILNAISDYEKTIIDANISWVSQITSLLYSNKSKNADSLFEKVSNLIGKMDKLLIIQIDDIDRLAKEEVFHALRLIRNIANFKNTVFIVACDKEYLAKSLKSMDIDEEYLEKIFNVNHILPIIRKNELIDIVENNVKKGLLLNKGQYNIVDKFFEIIQYNLSLRNAKILIESIQMGWANLFDEDGNFMIDLLDYMLISYLKNIDYGMYEYLAEFKISNNYSSPKEMPIIIRDNNIILNKNKGSWQSETLTEQQYKNDRLKPFLSSDNIELVYTILHELFNKNRYGVARIKYTNSFHMYFNRQLNEKLVYKKDFYDAFNKGSNEFQEKLINWRNNYDNHSLDRLICSAKFDTKEEWMKLFNDILAIAPLRYYKNNTERIDKIKEIIPTPGLDLLELMEKNNEYNNLYIKSLTKFIFIDNSIKDNNIETLHKKLTLSFYYEEIISGRHRFVRKSNFDYSYKNLFKSYWSLYNELGFDYSDFNEDFWYILSKLSGSDNLDAKKNLKLSIEENIESFISKYTPEVLSNSLIWSLFVENDKFLFYDPEISDWISNYINFLDSIEEKSEALKNYIENVKVYYKL